MQRRRTTLMLATLISTATAAAADYSWQQPHATVLPSGNLAWAPQDFTYQPEGTIRYIDPQNGDDRASGASPQAAWRHHPWDKRARGKARGAEADTWVLKGGSIYRATLSAPVGASGIITRDPDWGEGPAWIYGSETVQGWRQEAHRQMPDGQTVWAADLDFLPRNVWAVASDGSITRLHLARIPDWEVVDPENEMSQWWQWEQPKWWLQFKGQKHNPNTMTVKGKTWHLGIDTKNLGAIGEDAVGGYVRTEWGIPTGNDPYPAEIHAYDPKRKGIAFGSPWNEAYGGMLFAGHRYFLEDRPQWLDQPGEFWFDRKNDGGTLYVRLPGDATPEDMSVEAARRLSSIEAADLGSLRISGLGFRFNNIIWDMDQPQYMGNDVMAGVVRLRGPAQELSISNCRFEHVHLPLRAEPGSDGDLIEAVRFTDNDVLDTDHGVIEVSDRTRDRQSQIQGRLIQVDALRNRCRVIGMRGTRGRYNAGIRIKCPLMMEVAGNIMQRTASQGIEVYGGKLNGDEGEWPFSRILVHHNQVTDSMLRASDWAGIEMWQGGPFYVYNNNSGAPQGLMNWSKGEGRRFGFSYYYDGGFKGYSFNNIAWARTDNEDPILGSKAAFQTVLGMQNSHFNNSISNFKYAFHRQAPAGGRNKYLGNIMQDISEMALKMADSDEKKSVNASHFKVSDAADYATNAIASNLFHDIAQVGIYGIGGHLRENLADFDADMAELGHTGPASSGVIASEQPMPRAAEQDYRPAAGSGVAGMGVRVFVPWALSATVGEWHFTPNSVDPDRIVDEAWYMTRAYDGRDAYSTTPRYPLQRSGGSFVDGTLEDWCPGALELDEADHLRVAHATLVAPYEIPDGGKKKGRAGTVIQGADKPTVDMDRNDFLLEIVLRSEDADGHILSKQDEAGYRLELVDGRVRLVLHHAGQDAHTVTGPAIADGAWHHILVEVDRQQGVRMYVDGASVAVERSGSMVTDSLSNASDFVVGADLAATIDFLRVTRSTLADAYTDIDELHTWQFDGPQLRDFTGRPRGDEPTAGAIELDD
ncbi:MAG: laminin G domain-containing protein [Planctomycetota bacterium]